MPIRVRIEFKENQRDDINYIFKKEMERYQKANKELKKPLSRIQKYMIAREMKKKDIPVDQMEEVISKMHDGYEFTAKFTSKTTAYLEWKNHFLVDYEGEAGEVLAKILYPMYFGFGANIKDIGRAIATGQFKRALFESLNDAEPVVIKTKRKIYEESCRIFEALDCVVIVE